MNVTDDRSPWGGRRLRRSQLLTRAAGGSAGVVGLAWLAETPTAHAAMPLGAAAQQLSNAMRLLWEQHVWWTRLYIVSFAAGLPETNATAARLLRNQVDLGNAIKPFYGTAAGTRLTALLKQHILGAVAIVSAAKAGTTAKLTQATTAWYANADAIALFLHGANPQHWPLPVVAQMMHRHLKLTLQEATAELHGNAAGSIAAFEQVEHEILQMADTLTAGIVAQFPQRFGGG